MNRLALILAALLLAALLLAGCATPLHEWTLREDGPRVEGRFIVTHYASDGSVVETYRTTRCIAYREGPGVYFLDEQGREVWLSGHWSRVDVTDEAE